ncbi:hypothetical protein [Mesorhizobium abyssinicae]|uniref:hypothetical protein n=1 Tax=Mesorhizobium abyssinicae TaxID=1209958 RepID=UPI00339575C4
MHRSSAHRRAIIATKTCAVRPDLFQAWLDANPQVASYPSRQRYAQELLDTRAARGAAYDEEHRQEIEAAAEYPAAPVYTPRDYPLILGLSATGNPPATWKEWWENSKASEAERRRQGLLTTRVRVHAGKFKAWLQANQPLSSEQTRQKYAQQRLNMKRARRAARRAEERLPWARRLQLLTAASQAPSPWPHKAIEVLAHALLAVAIATVLLAVKWLRND